MKGGLDRRSATATRALLMEKESAKIERNIRAIYPDRLYTQWRLFCTLKVRLVVWCVRVHQADGLANVPM